jgi:UDP-N-acetylglucosamine/UDP-N-acetylgalactosamine diphosphorylase
MKQTLLKKLANYQQQHLLAFWDELSAAEQEQLAAQIEAIDFDQIERLYRGDTGSPNWADLAKRAAAPPAYRLSGEGRDRPLDDVRKLGEELLSAGNVGVILVAGGQGSRLGFEHPKGMYPIGPISGASLFQVLLEKIIARGRRHGVRIPLYLMTSPATHDETVTYLHEHKNFGLPADDVLVFCQGTMPAVDMKSGKLLLAEKGLLFTGPDGHGGMLAALAKSGGLADAKRRGIEQLFYCQIDNPLVSMCDPAFLGYHHLAKSEVSTQVVAKRSSRDKVGNVVVIDDRMQVIEYSDLNHLPDDIVERKTPEGSPVFWAGSIAVHVFERSFLDRMASSADGLPFHIAKKAVPFVDIQGKEVKPSEPNAIKFERFIFDLLPAARHGIVVEVDEQQVFAPLKNAATEKTDTEQTVKAARMAVERGWLSAAGIDVGDNVTIEISPLFAQDTADVLRQAAGLPKKIERATHLSSSSTTK